MVTHRGEQELNWPMPIPSGINRQQEHVHTLRGMNGAYPKTLIFEDVYAKLSPAGQKKCARKGWKKETEA